MQKLNKEQKITSHKKTQNPKIVLNKKPDKKLKKVMVDNTHVINQKDKQKAEMKLNLAKQMVYFPKSKLRKTIWVNEKKLTFSAYPPVKKSIMKLKKKNFISKMI